MPPPKRPFITSSLTSTLKSTIANQPLLSNLTNIDKLSSQASSFAQKSPFFANLTNQHTQQQQQQHNQTADDARPQQDVQPLSSSSGNNNNNKHHLVDSSNNGSNAAGDEQSKNIMRAGNSAGLGYQHQQQQHQQQTMPAASTPTVDMSHLTEEERLMIQSVMAKAEMADMGIPVDTSAPSSTNLPSNASQALVQQQNQARQQQQQARMASNPARPHQQQNINQVRQVTGQMAANDQQGQNSNFVDQQLQQQQQQQQQHHQQQQQQHNMMLANNQADPAYGQSVMASSNQQPFNQAQFQQPQQQQQQQIYQNIQQVNGLEHQQQQVASLGGPMQPALEQTNRNTLPSLEQQTQKLVSQINSQFNLNQPPQNQQQQQQHQPQQRQPNAAVGGHQASLGQQQQNPAEQQIPNNRSIAQQHFLTQQQQPQQQVINRLADGGLVNSNQPMLQNLNQTQQQILPLQQHNPLMQQSSFSIAERQQQLPSQQQQQPQQQHQMNTLPNEPMGMMQQATQMDQDLLLASKQQFASNNPSNIIHQASVDAQFNTCQMVGFMNQQQQQNQLNNMKLIEPPLTPYSLNQQQQQPTSIDQFQAAEVLANQQGLQYNNAAITNPSSTSQQISATDMGQQQAVNSLFNNERSLNNNLMLMQQQPSVYPSRESPFSQHDPRDDIRFAGRQQVAFDTDYYNEHALSDQEHHSRGRHLTARRALKQQQQQQQQPQQQGGRAGMRRHDSADQPSSGSGRYHLSRDKYGFNKREPANKMDGSRRDRSLQAYDLAQHCSAADKQPTSTKTRQLPQPTNQKQPGHHNKLMQASSTNERPSSSAEQRLKSKSRKSSAHRFVRPTSSRQESPYLSLSDDEEEDELEGEREEDGEEEEDDDDDDDDNDNDDDDNDEREAQSFNGRRKKQVTTLEKGRTETTTTVRASSSNSSGPKNDTAIVDKSEEALRLLSEFKLTEQANQVMEQQQLLIKQGQELIKLQLEQQALSQELKKSMNKPTLDENLNPDRIQTIDEKREQNDENDSKLENSHQENQIREDSSLEYDNSIKQSSQIRATKSLVRDLNETKPKNLTTSLMNNRDSDDTNEDSPRALSGLKFNHHHHHHQSSKITGLPDDANNIETRSVSVKKHQLNTRGGDEDDRNTRKGLVSNSSQTTFNVTPRYNRDLLQSPTDTTDSDIEPLTQASLRRQQQQRLLSTSQTKPKGTLSGRRREPAGLPPSPLPVAAAIQLHQMQQQHLRQSLKGAAAGGGGTSTTSRANFMRSRSVTSSPNHHLENANSGYLTDSQRIRSTSPDALSEFGGQRRRKRLPEPPTNLVPITPSMVRKMIQAQRASNAPTRLPTSVNAQTTLLTNTHSTRSGAFDRPPPNEGNLSLATSTRAAINNPTPGSYLLSSLAHQEGLTSGSINSGSSLSTQHQRTSNDQLAPSSSTSQSQQLVAGVIPTTTSNNPSSSTIGKSTSDLNKFLSSTYGSSILRTNNISDVKETPELDKLISNLDDYYGLDNANKRLVRVPPTTDNLNSSSQLFMGDSYHNPSSTSHLDLISDGPSLSSSYHQQHNVSYNPARSVAADLQLGANPSGLSSLTRCYSEGEDGGTLASRLASKRPYFRQGASQNYDTDLTSNRLLTSRPNNQFPSSSIVSHLNGPTSGTYLLDHSNSTTLRQPSGSAVRFSDATNPTNRSRDSYQMVSPNDQQSWRPSSSSYYTRPTQAYPPNRSPLKSTGSLDLGVTETDYLSNEQRLPYSSHLPDYSSVAVGQRSAYTQSRYSATDAIRDRYRERYSAASESPSRFGRSDYNTTSPLKISQASEYGSDIPQRTTSYLGSSGTPHLSQFQNSSFDLDSRRAGYLTNMQPASSSVRQIEATRSRANPYSDHMQQIDPKRMGYLIGNNLATTTTRAIDNSSFGYNIGQTSEYLRSEPAYATDESTTIDRLNSSARSSFAPLTKDDIINNGPKFNSIGYRFRTENQNKYVAQTRAPIQSIQSRYPHPYKRILLSKNPKDRIGNGIGVRIIGGQPIPSLYDKVNGCIITSGAFVTEVFQNSNVYFMGEMQEGDQIIEWNGVNLCNRSDQEVQQILLSQLSDDEVEIVFLHLEQFNEAYNEVTETNDSYIMSNTNSSNRDFNNKSSVEKEGDKFRGESKQNHRYRHDQQDLFDTFADMNKPSYQRTVSPSMTSNNRGRQYAAEVLKGSIRRKISLSSIAHMWSAR